MTGPSLKFVLARESNGERQRGATTVGGSSASADAAKSRGFRLSFPVGLRNGLYDVKECPCVRALPLFAFAFLLALDTVGAFSTSRGW